MLGNGTNSVMVKVSGVLYGGLGQMKVQFFQ